MCRQYKYSAMSNLVLQADRRFITRRTDEATGDPESLAGRLSINDMGSRVARDAAPKQKKSAMPDVQRGSLQEVRISCCASSGNDRAAPKGAGILAAADLVEGPSVSAADPGYAGDL